MAPSTRLSGTGLGASSYSQGIDGILSQYHEFKRKHIAQNRQIIKTNAELQIRHRDLERRIQTLEAQRNESEIEKVQLQADYERAQQALRGVAKGWQAMARNLEIVASAGRMDLGLNGYHDAGADGNDEGQGHKDEHETTPKFQRQAMHLQPGKRITLGTNALPANDAVKRVAQPPNLLYPNLMEQPEEEEEEGKEEEGDNGAIEAATQQPQGEEEADEGEDEDEEEAEESRDDDTIRVLASSASDEQPSLGPPVREQGAISRQRLAPAKRAARRSSGVSQAAEASRAGAADASEDEETERTLRTSSSIDSLSSFVDDGEIQLSEDDDGDEDDNTANFAIAVERNLSQSASPMLATATNRKRKVPTSPETLRQTPRSTSPPSSTAGEEEEDGDDDGAAASTSRRSARSSVRSRSSVNYALPKLNTKMRKPDPVDLVPAGAAGGSSGGQDTAGPRGSRTESSKGNKRRSGGSSGRTPSTALRGRNGVASSGNLSDLRKRHQERGEQQQQQHAEDPATELGGREDASGDGPRPQSMPETAPQEWRKQARKSSGRRTSSSTKGRRVSKPEESNDEEGEEQEEDGRSTGGDDEYESDGRSQDGPRLVSSSVRAPAETRPPLANTAGNGKEEGALHDFDGLFKSVHDVRPLSGGADTPIPKPSSMAHGKNIKALKLAGRLPSGHAGVRPKMVSRPSGKTSVAVKQSQSSATGANGRSFSASDAGLSSQTQGQGQGQSQGSGPVTGSGQAKQRASLHAAMTNP